MARKSRKNPIVQEKPAHVGMKVWKAALYIRLSVEFNGRRGDSLETQQQIMEAYLALCPDIEIVAVYTDNGTTGRTFEREAFQRMLDDVEHGRINCVVVKDLSRLGRNAIDSGYYIEKYFPLHQVRFIAVNDQFDSENKENSGSHLIVPLKNMINEAYAADISKKVKAQQRQAMQDGEFVGARPPFGYKKAPDNCHKLLVNEDTAPIVRQIFQWTVDGISLNEVVKRLNQSGYPTPGHYLAQTGLITNKRLMGSGKWQTWTVSKILADEVYMGDMVQGKSKTVGHKQVPTDRSEWIVVRGTHEPLIARELYERVQAVRERAAAKQGTEKIPYTENILRGRIFCGCCGKNLHRQRSRGIYSYRCIANDRMGVQYCPGGVTHLPEKRLFDALLAIIRKHAEVVVGTHTKLKQQDYKITAKKAKMIAEISKLQQETERNRVFLTSLYENFVTGILTGTEYHEMKAGYTQKIETAVLRVQQLQSKQKALENQMERYTDIAKRLAAVSEDTALSALLVNQLIDCVTVNSAEDIHVKFKFESGFERLMGCWKMYKPYVIGLYIRLSSEDSKVGSFSIENQKRALHQYADAMEDAAHAEVLEFVDNGYSGTNFERPAVQELLDKVREGAVNCIIVKDFTRFGRNSIEVGYFMERVFPLYGVRFISLNDGFDSDTLHGDTGGINVAFQYLISEFYSRDLSIKYKTAKYVKFRRGEYQSVLCPYGYQKGADGRMEPDEETAPNVRLIFELAGRGCTSSEIIQELYERKIPTPGEYKASKGRKIHDISRTHQIWQRSTIRNILLDERYIGTYVMGRKQVVEVGSSRVRNRDESEWFRIPDHHPAIISKELFQRVQELKPKKRCIKKNVHLYPLRGKVFCGCCGHAMPRNPSKSHAFVCKHTEVDQSAACHGLRITEKDLEAILYEIISKQAQVILNVENLSNASLLDAKIATHTEYSQRVESCLDRKRVLYEQVLLKEITLEEYKAQKADVDAELERLRQVQGALSAEIAQAKMDAKTKNARLKLAQEISAASGLNTALADALIERVDIHPGNQVDIVWKMKDFCTEGM